jgi:hypothetical protein
MTALSKFLVLLAIFLLASLGDAFVNHARLNHLIRFDASKSNQTIKPSHVPTGEPTNEQMTMNNQMAFGHKELIKLNMAFGRNELIELKMAFSRNKLIELEMAFGRSELIKLILAFGRNKLLKLIATNSGPEGAVHFEAVSINVESPHDTTRVNCVESPHDTT